MENILEVRNVSKSYANHLALNNIDVTVPVGSIFGLLGPNGAGKTSLIRIINQITGPDTGTILINGEELAPSHISQIGYLPEERGLYRKMKVGEQALYLAQLKGLSKSQAFSELKKWFKKFEIEGWWHKKVEELSKGMQQKVQFIVTVLHKPKILILDEPFSGFDPINTNLIKQEILNLNKEGATIIFSTHNMSSVEEICNHICLINNSINILEGSVEQIRNNYKSNTFELTFTGNMIGFSNALWTGFEIIETNKNEELINTKIKIKEGKTPNQLLEAVLPHIQLKSFNEVLPSMNEIFIQKVSEINNELAA